MGIDMTRIFINEIIFDKSREDSSVNGRWLDLLKNGEAVG
jgi:hypothetical protein